MLCLGVVIVVAVVVVVVAVPVVAVVLVVVVVAVVVVGVVGVVGISPSLLLSLLVDVDSDLCKLLSASRLTGNEPFCTDMKLLAGGCRCRWVLGRCKCEEV